MIKERVVINDSDVSGTTSIYIRMDVLKLLKGEENFSKLIENLLVEYYKKEGLIK